MAVICQICKEQLKNDQYIEFMARSTFHLLKSKIIYAIDKNDLDIDQLSIVHVDCLDSEDNPDYEDVEID